MPVLEHELGVSGPWYLENSRSADHFPPNEEHPLMVLLKNKKQRESLPPKQPKQRLLMDKMQDQWNFVGALPVERKGVLIRIWWVSQRRFKISNSGAPSVFGVIVCNHDRYKSY